MREHVTQCLVLDKEPLGELDWRVILFTQELGKLGAKIKSGRRITSKLSGHLEPLMCTTVRLIEKNGFQVADAIARGRLVNPDIRIAFLLRSLLPERHRDDKVWDIVMGEGVLISNILAALGFDPKLATCQLCERQHPNFFLLNETEYICGSCIASYPNRNGYIAVNLMQGSFVAP